MSTTVELTEQQLRELRTLTKQQDISIAVQHALQEYIRLSTEPGNNKHVRQEAIKAQNYQALFELAGQDAVDSEVHKKLRDESRIFR